MQNKMMNQAPLARRRVSALASRAWLCFRRRLLNNYRRRILLALSGFVLSQAACSQGDSVAAPGTPPLSPEDARLKHKFRGLKGGQLVVDSIEEIHGVNIFDEHDRLFYARASVSLRNNSKHSYGAEFGVPKTLRVEWRDAYRPVEGIVDGANGGGILLGNYTVPVASRIPEEVLDGISQRIGGFRLKIRIHRDGPLIGWDLSRGFNLQYMAGGDFREADIENGQVVRKGWYIHPRTKERIETDF